MATIAVDFDGPLHAYRGGWRDGSIYDDPTPGGLEALRTLMGEYAVYVHTCRQPEMVAAWLRAYGVPALSETELRAQARAVGAFWDRRDVVLVTDRKLPAVAYIDDRGIRFVSWQQTHQDLRRYRTPRTGPRAAPPTAPDGSFTGGAG